MIPLVHEGLVRVVEEGQTPVISPPYISFRHHVPSRSDAQSDPSHGEIIGGQFDEVERRDSPTLAKSGFASRTSSTTAWSQWVASSVPHSFWARAFYESHRAKGASHNATIRALAFKWIRILFRCWVDRTPYNESRYLDALQKQQSPLLKFAAQPSS